MELYLTHTTTIYIYISPLVNKTPKRWTSKHKWLTWFMWGWCHADFPLVSQQHGTSHRIELYHIILIREMCWKAISSSNKWPTGQQKQAECHHCRQRLCHDKSLILNPLTCLTHSKSSLREKGAFLRWEQGRRAEKKGLRGGVRGTLGEKRLLGSHQHL